MGGSPLIWIKTLFFRFWGEIQPCANHFWSGYEISIVFDPHFTNFEGKALKWIASFDFDFSGVSGAKIMMKEIILGGEFFDLIKIEAGATGPNPQLSVGIGGIMILGSHIGSPESNAESLHVKSLRSSSRTIDHPDSAKHSIFPSITMRTSGESASIFESFINCSHKEKFVCVVSTGMVIHGELFDINTDFPVEIRKSLVSQITLLAGPSVDSPRYKCDCGGFSGEALIQTTVETGTSASRKIAIPLVRLVKKEHTIANAIKMLNANNNNLVKL